MIYMTILENGHIKEDNMPAIFSEEQREQIRQEIKKQAKELFSQKSIRKTSVAELAERVGIAKGTFYHFYASKGTLVAEIIDDYNAVSEKALRQMLEEKGRIPLEEFADFYKNAFRPESSFAYHFSPDDIKWMTETQETKHFFNAEDSIRLAQLILSYSLGRSRSSGIFLESLQRKIHGSSVQRMLKYPRKMESLSLRRLLHCICFFQTTSRLPRSTVLPPTDSRHPSYSMLQSAWSK